MSDQDALTPRLFLARHGETTWAKSGRYTGRTDLDLTPTGASQVSSTSAALVGAGKLVDPSRLAHVFVSPRKRATRTFELLLGGTVEGVHVTVSDDIAEWDYGDYEGLKAGEIRKLREQRGLDLVRKWNIWQDGCEGGESMDQVTERLDRLISRIREIQRPGMNGEKPVDVLLVAHGLILRCFVKRWLRFSVSFSLPMMLAPGAIAVLSYKNNDIDEPAFYVGMALPCEEEGCEEEGGCSASSSPTLPT